MQCIGIGRAREDRQARYVPESVLMFDVVLDLLSVNNAKHERQGTLVCAQPNP